jgi:hypothetical protein
MDASDAELMPGNEAEKVGTRGVAGNRATGCLAAGSPAGEALAAA